MIDNKDVFKEIVDLLEHYPIFDSEYRDDHPLEGIILEMIDKNPEVLVMQSADKKNIGMMAARYGFGKIASMALDNSIAATQQDKDGNNIGMIAAEYGMREVAIKALQNSKAREQVNKNGFTIMKLAEECWILTDEEENVLNEIKNGNMPKRETKMDKTISDIYNDIFGM